MQTSRSLLLSTAALLVGCGGAQSPPVDPVDAEAANPPRITATATPTTVAAGESFTIAVEIENFEVVNPTTTPGIEPGEGHFHYQLDTWDNYTAAWTSSVTVATTGVAPGEHTVRLWLVDGSHFEIEPLTETTVSVTVE